MNETTETVTLWTITKVEPTPEVDEATAAIEKHPPKRSSKL